MKEFILEIASKKQKMKNKNKKLTALLLLGIGFNQGYAQQATTASGGDASGSGGSVAHSVGQTVYTTNTGSNGSVAQGVEQPYEISITTGLAETGINLIFTCLSQSNNKLFDVAN